MMAKYLARPTCTFPTEMKQGTPLTSCCSSGTRQQKGGWRGGEQSCALQDVPSPWTVGWALNPNSSTYSWGGVR